MDKNLLLLLNGSVNKIIEKHSLINPNNLEVIKFDEKDFANFSKVLKILKKDNYNNIFIANLDNSFQRFQFFIFLYSFLSFNFNYYLVDELGNNSKFNLLKFIFIQTPLFLLELIISSIVILYFNFRLNSIYSKIK